MNKKELLNLLNKARYYHNYLEDENKAIILCDKILKEDPENIDALLVKAGSLPYINKEKEAFELTKKIIEKWPNHWEAYYLMGLLLFNINEERAMQNFDKSISLKKTFDNTISAAQLAYFMENQDYELYMKYAEKIDPIRYNNYMKNFWEWEIC